MPFPAPSGYFADALGGMVGEPGEDIGQPRVRIDVVETTGLNEGIDGNRPTPSFIGSREGPIAAPDRHAAQGALRGVV